MKRETQCKLYQSLTITGVVLLVIKAYALTCPLLGLGEPIDIELNTPAIEEEYKKQFEPIDQEWIKDLDTNKWVLVTHV